MTMRQKDMYHVWYAKAEDNIEKWGLQDPSVLLLAIQEELGELTKAYLEATYEGGDHDQVREELHDLGALMFQFHWSVHESERAFMEVGERE